MSHRSIAIHPAGFKSLVSTMMPTNALAGTMTWSDDSDEEAPVAKKGTGVLVADPRGPRSEAREKKDERKKEVF